MCDNCVYARNLQASIMCDALIAMQRAGDAVYGREAILAAALDIMNVLDESHCKHNVAFENTSFGMNDGEAPAFA